MYLSSFLARAFQIFCFFCVAAGVRVDTNSAADGTSKRDADFMSLSFSDIELGSGGGIASAGVSNKTIDALGDLRKKLHRKRKPTKHSQARAVAAAVKAAAGAAEQIADTASVAASNEADTYPDLGSDIVAETRKRSAAQMGANRAAQAAQSAARTAQAVVESVSKVLDHEDSLNNVAELAVDAAESAARDAAEVADRDLTDAKKLQVDALAGGSFGREQTTRLRAAKAELAAADAAKAVASAARHSLVKDTDAAQLITQDAIAAAQAVARAANAVRVQESAQAMSGTIAAESGTGLFSNQAEQTHEKRVKKRQRDSDGGEEDDEEDADENTSDAYEEEYAVTVND
eukprot:TRINITY_DN16486_c0_g1_i1.p1 TRINITY_DN16486_c0_g1~~TRINITY_DN16486_c0_g1_i1.p1  ORF type:complete len:346 (-),score=75.59 TRINITY_DN16486_c0_g1_i1:50-1087(-)